MKQKGLFLWITCVVLVMGWGRPGGAAAANQKPVNGLPASPAFGYGGKIDPFGPAADEALQVARLLQFDWVGVDLDWSRLMPGAISSDDLATLDAFMTKAAEAGLPVMLSIRQAPDWALTPEGPSAEITAIFARELGLRYPALQAIELFPGANTASGWGSTPDPEDYAALLLRVRGELLAHGLAVHLVAGGFIPAENTAAGDLPETEFLRGLYTAGAAEVLQIVSLSYPVVEEDLLAAPDGPGAHAFRRYEALRQVMLEAGHPEELLWITGFSWPESLAPTPGTRQHNHRVQTEWLQRAYTLLNAQLYIGTAFFAHLNAPAGSGPGFPSLVRPDTSLHPALESLGNMILLRGTSLYTAGKQAVEPPAQVMLPLKRMFSAYKQAYKPAAFSLDELVLHAQ